MAPGDALCRTKAEDPGGSKDPAAAHRTPSSKEGSPSEPMAYAQRAPNHSLATGTAALPSVKYESSRSTMRGDIGSTVKGVVVPKAENLSLRSGSQALPGAAPSG